MPTSSVATPMKVSPAAPIMAMRVAVGIGSRPERTFVIPAPAPTTARPEDSGPYLRDHSLPLNRTSSRQRSVGMKYRLFGA